jgi:DNA polymerase-3 subunit epsilon
VRRLEAAPGPSCPRGPATPESRTAGENVARPNEEEASPSPEWTRFVGAGTTAGAAGERGPLHRLELYDFSFLDPAQLALAPDRRDQVLDRATFVVFDTETTGLEPDRGDRVVSLAGVKVQGGTVRRSKHFDALVNPGRPIPPGSAALHGITDARVVGMPSLEAVMPAFLRFAQGAVLVGHEVWFDLRFLEPEAKRLGLPSIASSHPVLDTHLLSRLVHGELPEHGLDAVAGRLGVTIQGRHSALGDAYATAEALVRLLGLLRGRGVTTLGALLDAVGGLRRPLGGA